MNITDELVDELAEVGKSAAQKNAITVALQQLRDRAENEADQPQPMPLLMPARKRVLVLLSGRFARSSGPTDSELQSVREDLAVMNSRAIDQTGESLHVITAGRMGAEREALAWCQKNKIPVHEMAACFAIPNEDGTTTRRPDARDRRNKRIRAFVHRALEADCEVGVKVYGNEQDRDKVAPAIADVIARFNRQQTPTPPGSAETSIESDTGPVAETLVEGDEQATAEHAAA